MEVFPLFPRRLHTTFREPLQIRCHDSHVRHAPYTCAVGCDDSFGLVGDALSQGAHDAYYSRCADTRDASSTLTRTQHAAIPGKRGDNESLIYAGLANLCNAQ